MYDSSCSVIWNASLALWLALVKNGTVYRSTRYRGLNSSSTKGDASFVGYPHQGDASVPTQLHTTPAPTRPGTLVPDVWWKYYLLPQRRCQHRVEDKDQRERHAQDVLSSSEEGHSG